MLRGPSEARAKNSSLGLRPWELFLARASLGPRNIIVPYFVYKVLLQYIF